MSFVLVRPLQKGRITLRHSYASNLVNAGTSIYVVSRALGHASLKNTARYSHLSQETLLEAADKAADVLAM